MIINENVNRVVPEIKDVQCNACGGSCRKNTTITDNAFEFATISATWGYFSDNRDGQSHEAHLCQSCFDALIKNFTIQPTVTRYF